MILVKRLTILLCIAAIALFAAACGRTESPAISDSPKTEEFTASAAPSGTAEPDIPLTETESVSEPEANSEISGDPGAQPKTTAPPVQSGSMSSGIKGGANESASGGKTEKPTAATPEPTKPPTQTPTQSQTQSGAPSPTDPPTPQYTKADYDAIVSEVTVYAQSKTRIHFVWESRLEMGDGDTRYHNAGYNGRPNLTILSRAAVVDQLKYHVDKIENLILGQSGEGAVATYKVIWREFEGNIEFIVLYG
jgi:hypothetical protein